MNTPEVEKNYHLRFLSAKKSSKFNNSDLLGIFAIGALALNSLTFIWLVFLSGSYSQLAKKPAPALVQLADGRAINVVPLGSKERTPEVILRFVEQTFTMLMNWSNTVPGKDAKSVPDPGVDIETNNIKSKVTTSAFQASFALSEDFRREFLKELAKLTPSGVFNGSTKVVFVPLYIEQPVQIEPGKWKVSFIGNLMIFAQSNIAGDLIPFNKLVYVRAVEAPKFQPGLSAIAQSVYEIRAAGLEIYAITDAKPEDIRQ